MNIEIRKQMNALDIDAAHKLIRSGQKEVELASSFPLSMMPQLLSATKIDLAIAKKMLEAALLDQQALPLGNTPEADLLRLQAAKKRNAVATQKELASNQLTEERELQSILKHVNQLGKKRSKRSNRSNRSKRSSRRRNKK